MSRITTHAGAPANFPWLRVLQSGVTLAAFGYVFANVDRDELAGAFSRVSLGAWLAAAVLLACALCCGLLRWWCLLRAFGAERLPTLGELAGHYAAGYFYNTYLPGGVTGDVVRGVATRGAFAPGSAGSYATVFVERALGFAALLALTTLGALSHPLPGLGQTWLPAALACVAVLGCALGLFNLRRLSLLLPRFLQRWVERLPRPAQTLPLLAAGGLSFITQLAPALSGHVLVSAIIPGVRLADSLVIVPLAASAAFIPISVSGAGVREGIFVVLYGLVGVPRQAALAASLSLWFVQALLAALGRLWLLLRRAPRPE